MPIFETKDGQKYDVDDEYINDFRDENPDAKYILERNGQKYRVAFDDYQAFIDTFDGGKNTPQAPQAPTAPTTPKVGSLNWYTAKNAGDAVKNVANNSALASATKAKSTEATDNLAKVKGTADVAQNTQGLIHTTPIESKALELAQFKAKNKAMFDSMAQRTADMGEYYTKSGANVGKVVETAPEYNAETGEFETQYITPTLNREENKAIADAEAREYKHWIDVQSKYVAPVNMTTSAQLRRVEERIADIDNKMHERAQQLMKEEEENKQSGFLGFLNEATRVRSIARSGMDREAYFNKDSDYQALALARRQLEDQRQQLQNKQGTEKYGERFWGDFGRGLWQSVSDIDTWDFGASVLNDAKTMSLINNKIENNIELTDAEANALEEIAESQAVKRYVGDLGSGYNLGSMTGQSLGFAAQMALTGGFSGAATGIGTKAASAVAKAAAKKIATESGKKIATSIAQKGIIETAKSIGKGGLKKMATEYGLTNATIATTRALGVGADILLVRAPLHTISAQGASLVGETVKSKYGEVVYDDRLGTLRFVNDKSWSEAAWQTAADKVIENASEMIGAHFFGLTDISKAFGARNLTAAILRATRENAGTVLSKTSQLLQRIGVNGYFGEVGEEYTGQLWRTMLNLESAKDDEGNNLIFSGKFNGDIWGGMAMSFGMMSSAALGANYAIKGVEYGVNTGMRKYWEHQVNKASAQASRAFSAEQWENMRQIIDATDNADMSVLAQQTFADNSLSESQKHAALTYMERSMNLRGYNLGRYMQSKNGMLDADAEAVNQSYADGYESNDAQEMADARKAVEIEEAKLRSALSGIDQEGVNAIMANVVADPVTAMQRAEDEALRDAIADYANAKAVYDGMQQRVADDIDTQIAVSDATIDRRTNRNTGKVQSVTLKNDKKVYVVGGTLNTTENGSVDFEHSDESIIVMDETGALEYSSPKNVLSIDNEIDPAEEKAISAEAIRQQAQAQAEANMSGKLTFTAGEQVQIKQEDGTFVNGTIVGPYTEDGKVFSGLVEVETQDGIKLPFEAEVLQTWADEARQARIEQFDADRSAEREQTRQAEQTSEVVAEETAVPAEETTTEPQVSALERVPTDEQGNPIYEQVDAETAWDAIVEQTEGDVAMAQTVANDMVKDKEKALKAAQNAKSKGGATIAEKIASEQERKANIQNAEQELAIWQAIASVPEARQQAMVQAQAEAEAERVRQIKEAEERAKIEAEEKAKAEAEALKAQQEADALRLQQEAEAREAEERAKAITEAEEARRESLRQRAERWGKETGVKVHIMESLNDVKTVKARNAIKMGKKITGWYVKKTGEAFVYLPNIESNRDIDDTFVHEVVAHKGVSEMLGKEKFDALCDKVWASMSEDAQKHFEAYPGVKEIKDESERHRAAADEYMAHLAESTNLTEEEQGVWSKIVDFIHDVMVKLGFDTITDEDIQRVVRASYANLRKKNVGRNKQITESSRNLNNGTVRFSVATYKDWTDSNGQRHKGTREQVIDRMTKSKFSKKDISTMIRKMDLAYDYMRKLEILTDADGNVRFDEFVKWAETKPYYKQIGKQYIKAITSLVSNGDYPINLELTTDCIKREAFTHLLNELVKRGADISKMGPGEIVTIQKLMKQYGIEVACELCFVEGKRLQIVNWAQQIVNDWNDAIAEAGLQTDEKFQFGKDGDAFIPVEEWKDYKDKTALQKAMRAIDQVEFMFKGIDPKTVIEQTAKNEAAVKAYIEEAQEKWASKSKKPKAQWKPTDEQKREIRALRIEGLTPTYINENMKEYKEAYEQMRAEWVAGAEGRDADAFTPNAEQWTKLDKIRNKQIDTVKQKMVRLIMEYPEMRKKMELNDLLGSKGLMNIRQQHGEAYEQLYSIILQRFGTGTPKPVQDAVPYDGEVMTLTQSKYDKANAIGGARLFSFSDFDITKVFDYMQMFFDLEANKQRLQSYTKEVAAILQFGRSNAKMNISTLAKAEVPESVKTEYKNASEAKQKELRHQYAENAGLKMNEDGTIAGINFSEEHSVSPEFAKTIFHDDTRNKDCGAIMVGCSVNHAIYSALQNWIRMVIPFHLSGMPIAAREKTDVLWYTDNTAFQSTRKKVDGKWKKISASEDTFSFYDDMDKKGWNMRDKARQYLAWCEEHGYRPKFDWGINSQKYIEYCEAEGYTPNQQLIEAMDADTVDGVWNQYYKFLTDFTAYKPIFNEHGEMIDEVPSPQQAIVTNFDMTELEKQVLYEADNSMLAHRESNIDKTQQYIDEIADKVEQYLSGNLSEENMDLKEDVFYENNADAERYLEELEVHEGVRFRFLGENGAERLDHAEEASTRLDNLAVAREMESAGAEAKNIKMATGWERGLDGKWRYETEDVKVKDLNKLIENDSVLLSEIIDDVELFSAYPHLKATKVDKNTRGGDSGSYDGAFHISQETLELGSDFTRSVLVHEIQHAIQEAEGWPMGRPSPNEAFFEQERSKWEKLQTILDNDYTEDELKALWKAEQDSDLKGFYIDMLGMMNDGMSMSEIRNDYEQYYNNLEARQQQARSEYLNAPGEVEARKVQERISMTPEQRRASLLNDVEDVAEADRNFIIENSGESSMGSRVNKRMAEIGNYYNNRALTIEQQSVVDVYSGESNNLPITINRSDGNVRVVMRQGVENKAGTKHSLLRHYGTNIGIIEAEDIILIPDVIANGQKTRKVRGNTTLFEYRYNLDDVVYTVVTEVNSGREEFADFYTNKNGEARSFNTQLSARADNSSSTSEVTQSFDNSSNSSEDLTIDNNDVRMRVVADTEKVAELESGDKVTAYRAVQIKKDGKIFSPMASRLKSPESGTKQEKNEAAQMKQWDEAVESLDKVDENGHITIKDEDGGTTEVSYNPYGHCCVNSMMNDQFKRAWGRDELYVMRVSAPESELTSGYHAEKAKDAVGIHKWKVGAVGRQLPEEKRREILLTRWMKNEEVMTWESVAEDWIKILDGEDVVVPFNVVPRKILNMIADAGVQIVAPENGMQKANKAYQQWLADPIGYVGDTELPMHVKALNEVEDDVRYRVGESLSGIVERIEQQSEQTNVADWMAKQNAVRAISGEMNQLRRAMSAQRKYDLTTVKAITRLAKEMLTNGMLDGTSQYSVKRILGAIERAHGKQDVSIEVKTLMDVMIDTQLQQRQKALQGMLSIKGSKVNAKGIEVQGKLDADGVAVVKAFKNAMGLPKESVENQIAEAMNRMGSRNEAVAADAANEYNGLMLALQYAEDITESKAEEKELRDSLKEARQDYEDGTLSRDAYNELVRSTEDAIRQNKLERAEAYQDLISQVFGGVSESAERAKAWREAENERVNNIHHYANSDMEGRPTNEHHQDALKQKLMNALASFVFAPMATFDQMLRMFGKKNRRGEGYLYNHFMGGWLKSAENEYLGYREALKELDAKVEAVFDGKIKRWGQLFSIDRKLGDVDVEFWDGGQMRPHTLTQGNLLYIYMVNKMADGQMKLRKMGITDEHVDAITRKLDPRFKQIADWLQEEFLVNKRNKYNEVHKRMFGASMASIDNYFPLKILANARIEKVDVGAETTEATLPSTATGSIIKRRKNNTALDLLNANAFSVILDHLKDMEHWAAFAEFNRDLNTLLSYKRFRNQVINITSVYGGGKQLWNEFRNVCALASGSYRPKTTKVDSFMLKAARGLSAAKVAGRIWTAIKQITSLPAFLSETNVITLSKNLSTPWIAWHWTMTNLPIAHKRWSSMTSGDPRLLQTKRDWADWQNRIGEISSHIGMAPNAFMDALSVSIGSYSVYESAKRKYLGYGYSESEAERKAMQAATIAFNQTQQSSEGAFLSTMQVDRTWLAQMFSVFRNNSFAYTRQLYDAIRGLANSLTTEEVEYMAKQMERDGIDPDKALVNAKKEVAKGTIRDLARLMLFGGGLTYIWELMGNLPYLIFGDDDEKKEEMLDSAAQRAMLGGLDGLAGGEAIVETALSAMAEEGTLRNIFKNGMPATSDIERALSKISSDQYSAFNDLVNIVAQYYAGINPQILIDAVVAIQDYCGDDAQTTNECALLIMRIIQCPQSQLDKVYFDEIDLSAEQASKLTPVQIAERYARYKVRRTRGVFGILSDKNNADSVLLRHKNKSLKLSKNAIGERLATDSTKVLLEEYDAINERKREINKLREDMPEEEWMKLNNEFSYSYNRGKHKRIGNYKKEMKDLTNRWLKTRSKEEADSLVNEMFNVRNKMLQDIPKFDKAYQEWKEREEE